MYRYPEHCLQLDRLAAGVFFCVGGRATRFFKAQCFGKQAEHICEYLLDGRHTFFTKVTVWVSELNIFVNKCCIWCAVHIVHTVHFVHIVHTTHTSSRKFPPTQKQKKRRSSIQSNPTQPSPVESNPIQSIQSNPLHPNPIPPNSSQSSSIQSSAIQSSPTQSNSIGSNPLQFDPKLLGCFAGMLLTYPF